MLLSISVGILMLYVYRLTCVREKLLFVVVHQSGFFMLLSLAVSLWSCIPSGVAYITPLELLLILAV